jgi:predicted metal-dependent phosphoesterase TrpH
MKADLHFHSKYSDGALWPRDLVEMAYNKGIEMVALTDHDTFEGVFDFIKAAKEFDIIAIPAVEINFVDSQFGFNSELLGYFPDGNFENTFNFLKKISGPKKKVSRKSHYEGKT